MMELGKGVVRSVLPGGASCLSYTTVCSLQIICFSSSLTPFLLCSSLPSLHLHLYINRHMWISVVREHCTFCSATFAFSHGILRLCILKISCHTPCHWKHPLLAPEQSWESLGLHRPGSMQVCPHTRCSLSIVKGSNSSLGRRFCSDGLLSWPH